MFKLEGISAYVASNKKKVEIKIKFDLDSNGIAYISQAVIKKTGVSESNSKIKVFSKYTDEIAEIRNNISKHFQLESEI